MVFGAQSQQGINLGTAHGKVIITTDVAEAMQQAQNAVGNGIQQIGSSIQTLGNNISNTGGLITRWTAPLTIFGATGIKAASDFDGAMKQIAARTGLTGDALETIRQQALRLGADTAFNSQQAADAFLQLLTAGLDVEQAMATLPNVLNAAAASGEDLGLSADLVTNVMSAFSIEATETERIVEAMSRAAASSPASMAEMGFALQDAGGIAKSFGLQLEDTAALFSIFAQRGIRGSEAATQLRSLLMNMTRDTEDTNQAWERLGTSMFDSEGNMRNLDTVLGEISTALAGMADEDRNEIVRALAGAYGRVGFEALLASDGINAMKDTMDSQTSAAEVAEQRMDAFDGAIESLMGSIQTLQIEALTPFMNETLKPLAQELTGVVNNITAWVKENPELAQALVRLGAAAVVVGPALVILGTVINAVGTVLSALGTAINLVLSPAFLLAGAIVAILVAAELGYPGGIVQLFRDATTSAQQLAFLGLYVLNLAAQNARYVLEQFRDAVIAVKDRVIEWIEQNGGIILGLSGLMISLKTTGIAAVIFNGILTVGQTIYGTVATLLGTAGTAAGGLGASMLAAAGPIIAVGVAIAGVIYQLKQFIETVQTAQEYAGQMLADEFASGDVSRQDLEAAAFDAISAQFSHAPALGILGPLAGDVAARLFYTNVADAVPGSAQLRDQGGPGIAGMPYLIRPKAGPELFVPSTNGQFIPNFDQFLQQRGQGDVNLHGDIIVQGASSYEAGLEAGRGVGDGVKERLRSRGRGRGY